jgi:hypothetical protein
MIRNRSGPEDMMTRALFRLWLSFQGYKRAYREHEELLKGYEAPPHVKIFILTPKRKTMITTLKNKEPLLLATIEQGYQETISNAELETFLK